MDNYAVVMSTRTRKKPASGWHVVDHLPTFLMPACSPGEAIIKVRAMFPKDLRIAGHVMRDEPYCDRFMDFDE